ncbi:MAG: purine-binding chemotaxis protein CheW [Rhodoferax sp.]|nr:purine-binding chemotaxis protein CheW [Rhodoferax sp.]
MNDSANHQRILHERALALAKENTSLATEEAYLEVTSFHLGREQYAFESRMIREIVRLREYTPLPCVPPFIAGILNLRGWIISLLDLRQVFGLPGASITESTQVIVLSDNDMEFGVLIDAIDGVSHIPLSCIQQHAPMLDHQHHKYVRGVTTERMIILDAQQLLHDPLLRVQEEVS